MPSDQELRGLCVAGYGWATMAVGNQLGYLATPLCAPSLPIAGRPSLHCAMTGLPGRQGERSLVKAPGDTRSCPMPLHVWGSVGRRQDLWLYWSGALPHWRQYSHSGEVWECAGDRGGAARYLQPDVDVLQVDAHGSLGHAKPVGDLGVGVPGGGQAQHLALAPG